MLGIEKRSSAVENNQLTHEAKTEKKMKTKLTALTFSLFITGLAVFGPHALTHTVFADVPQECHAKVCIVANEICACCLMLDGSIECDPCGGKDCEQP